MATIRTILKSSLFRLRNGEVAATQSLTEGLLPLHHPQCGWSPSPSLRDREDFPVEAV